MSNVIIGQVIPGSITCSYHIQCAGCNECRELDMTKEMLPIIEDSLRARAVRHGFHLMPFSPEEDRWFCTACAESRGADSKVFTAMREQVKAAAYLKSKAADEKHRSDYEEKVRKDRDTVSKVIASQIQKGVDQAKLFKKRATKKKPSRKKKPGYASPPPDDSHYTGRPR